MKVNIVRVMWFNKLQTSLHKRAFGSKVLLHCSRLIFGLLESGKEDAGKKAHVTIGNHRFDVIRKKCSKEIIDFRKMLIETV